MKNSPDMTLLTAPSVARRHFLFDSLAGTLSATAIALLAGKAHLASAAAIQDAELLADLKILGSALNAEREAIAAYQLGADSGLLDSGVLKVALTFQGHHKAHASVLAGTIEKFGGTLPVEPASYAFPVDKLKQQEDVLVFAAGLERGAVTAYVNAIPLFDDRELSRAAATILADESMHWAVLRQVLGLDPVPGAFFS